MQQTNDIVAEHSWSWHKKEIDWKSSGPRRSAWFFWVNIQETSRVIPHCLGGLVNTGAEPFQTFQPALLICRQHDLHWCHIQPGNLKRNTTQMEACRWPWGLPSKMGKIMCALHLWDIWHYIETTSTLRGNTNGYYKIYWNWATLKHHLFIIPMA